jgi:4-methyl-5(b-hydroxyethyl)-thiazole monophosphate biosynthesis
MKSAVVFLAPGFEEIEAITVVDVLRRAGVKVIVAGLESGPVTGSHEITVRPDTSIDQVSPLSVDMVVLPGGMPGSLHLRDDARVQGFLREMHRAGKYTCAICAAPVALKAAGIVGGRRLTSHPVVRNELRDLDFREDRVVVDGTLVTSRGAGTALEFSLELVRLLAGPEKASEVANQMLARVA